MVALLYRKRACNADEQAAYVVVVPNPAALEVQQLNLAFDDVGKILYEGSFCAVES